MARIRIGSLLSLLELHLAGVFGAGVGAFVDRARAKKDIKEMVAEAEERREHAPKQNYGEETAMLEDPKLVLQQQEAEKKTSR